MSSSPTRNNRCPHLQPHPPKEKVIIIMGATGAGKSRLSIDLAKLFPSPEMINSDKLQIYRGLDITTNRIATEDLNGVPHHLLGDVDPEIGEFTASDFRMHAGSVISDRRKLPIVAGGSNSFVHDLLVDRFELENNEFHGSSSKLRSDCCFSLVDVWLPVLSDYGGKRVDDMLNSGMVEELAEFFNSDRVRKGAYQEAMRAIKDNTWRLVKKQRENLAAKKVRVRSTEIGRRKISGRSWGKSGGGHGGRAFGRGKCWSQI